MNKTFVLAEVKAVDTKEPTGEFEAVLSAPTLDRDGEVIDAKAFEPLPDSIPIHAYHDFSDPVGRGVPRYEGDLLMVRGVFASTPRAQEMRTLVTEGIVTNMSVGFMSADREVVDKVPHITRAEILEGSFVSIPSNREAAVLVAKEYATKAGARNSKADAETLQAAHDLLVSLGAKCVEGEAVDEQPEEGDDDDEKSTDPAETAAAPAAADLPADVATAKSRAIAALAAAALA